MELEVPCLPLASLPHVRGRSAIMGSVKHVDCRDSSPADPLGVWEQLGSACFMGPKAKMSARRIQSQGQEASLVADIYYAQECNLSTVILKMV
jgi:hypothetical protein